MQRQNLGTPFLERIMRKGKKQNALLGSPRSGGVNLPSPTGIGSGQKPPPRKPPAAVAGGPPSIAPAPGAAVGPSQGAGVSPQQELLSLLDEEFPIDTGVNSDSGTPILRAPTLTERFYRARGRMPTDTDSYIMNIRKQFEKNQGRPPSRQDIIAASERIRESREVRPI